MTPDHVRAARELLAFYIEAGVDALVGETPVDRFAGGEEPARAEAPRAEPAAVPERLKKSSPRPSAAIGSPAVVAAPPVPEAAVMAARAAAKNAATLADLRAILDSFDG